MKTTMFLATLMMTLVGMVFSQKDPARSPVEGKGKSPLACNRAALTPEQRKRHFDELGPALRSRRQSVHELADGYEFEYPADANTYQMLTEWISGERVCCPFFDIMMLVAHEGGPIKLQLTGKDGVKRFVEEEGAVWIQR